MDNKTLADIGHNAWYLCNAPEGLPAIPLSSRAPEYQEAWHAAADAIRDAVLKVRIDQAVHDLHWMARRYADGRCSYAPGMFNGRVRDLMAAGFELCQPLFARDGMGRAFDGLTEDEVAAAEADMPRMHAKVIEAGEERFNAVWDQAVEACIAQIKEYGDGQNSSLEKAETEGKEGPTLVFTGATMAAGAMIDRLRSLKRSQSQTDTDDLCQAKSSTQGETVSREGALQATDGAEAMDHLGEVLSFFANLDEGDRCRAFEKAVVFYNKHNPNSQIQGEPGFTWHICQQGPLGFNCRRQIEEPANAGDEMTAASAEVGLTHKPLPPSSDIEGE